MLVLSRQRDETIMIGDDIEVTIVDVRGDKVRLGITAPTRIAVHRKEVYEAIKRENEQAASLLGADNGASDLRALQRKPANGTVNGAASGNGTTNGTANGVAVGAVRPGRDLGRSILRADNRDSEVNRARSAISLQTEAKSRSNPSDRG